MPHPLSIVCAANTHCPTCRRGDEVGVKWRASLARNFDVPGSVVNFECPEGKPWIGELEISTAVAARTVSGHEDVFHRLWDRLHRCPFLTAELLAEVRRELPCGECRIHFDAYVAANPPPFGRPAESFLWTVDFHDAVNALKGKPRFGRIAAAGKYAIELPSTAA